jgi:hypothetical protein
MGEFDEIQWKIKEAAATAFNQFADGVASDSELEVPVDSGDLKASALYPANDPGSRCAPEDLWRGSEVSYNTVYAAAQHEGFAVQHRMHPVVPITKKGVVVGYFTDTSRIFIHDVIWKVEHWSEPGTKDHFLSDPLKAKSPRLEAFTGASIAAALR